MSFAYKAIQQLSIFSFEPVVAVLDTSRVDSESDGDGTIFRAIVEYHYAINGTEHKSARLEFLDTVFGFADAQSRLPTAAIGDNLTAYFDPKSPDVSVLTRGLRPNDLIVPIFLLPFNAILLVGMIFVLDWLRSKTCGYSSL